MGKGPAPPGAQEGFGEMVADPLPVDAFRGAPRLAADVGTQPVRAGQLDGALDEAFLVAAAHDRAVVQVADHLGGCGIVVGDGAQPARHAFERDVAEGLGQAGKQEQIGRCVMGRQILAVPHAGKHRMRTFAGDGLTHRPVADDDHPRVRAMLADGGEGAQGEPEVLLRRQPSDADDRDPARRHPHCRRSASLRRAGEYCTVSTPREITSTRS